MTGFNENVCSIFIRTYTDTSNLVGDGFHNFIDGMMIAASFLVSAKLGMVTTVAIILHEIPQELGDFGVLVYGGFSKRKALAFNFLSAAMAMIGAIVGYFIAHAVENFASIILPLTAGGFIYIATSDLIPELHKESSLKRATVAFLAFIMGIAFTYLSRIFLTD